MSAEGLTSREGTTSYPRHKLFWCQAVKSGSDLSLSFILADYNENAVKLGGCPVSPSHCRHMFYKELHLGEATSV